MRRGSAAPICLFEQGQLSTDGGGLSPFASVGFVLRCEPVSSIPPSPRLDEHMKSISVESSPGLFVAVGPSHDYPLDRLRVSKPELQPQIAL